MSTNLNYLLGCISPEPTLGNLPHQTTISQKLCLIKVFRAYGNKKNRNCKKNYIIVEFN